MLFLIDCSVTMTQAHGWSVYEGVQVQQVWEGLHHYKIYLVWILFFPQKEGSKSILSIEIPYGVQTIAPFSFCFI